MLQGKNPERGFMGFGGNTTRLEAEVNDTAFVPKWSDAEKGKAAIALKAAGANADETTVDTYLRRKHKLPALPTRATQPGAAVDAPPTPEIPAEPFLGQD